MSSTELKLKLKKKMIYYYSPVHNDLPAENRFYNFICIEERQKMIQNISVYIVY